MENIKSAMGLQPRGATTTGWWLAGTAMAVVTVATIVGNGAVMAALWRVRRAPSHYPLISLVLADLMVGLTIQPLAAARELFVFNLNRVLCACWSTLDVLCCTASILSLCALGWERWSGITSPLTRARRARRARLFAILVWPIAFIVALPNAFIPSPKRFHPGEMEKACSVNMNVGYVFYSIMFSFYIPASMLVAMYGYILRALSAAPPIRAHRGGSPNVPRHNPAINNPIALSAKVDSTNNNPPNNKSFIDRQRRATKTIVTLMALFLVCWTPYFVILPLDSLYDCIWETTWHLCTWLGYINSALNPLVYAAASPSVRTALNSTLSSGSRKVDIPLTPRLRRE